MPVWSISQLDCYPDFDGEVDCVFTVHYDCVEVDGEYTGRVYGTVGITHDSKEPFTPYADLTKEQVVGWVKEALGEETVAAAEAAVAQQIADQKNPKVISPALPWATAA
jgi:hypothetical protein